MAVSGRSQTRPGATRRKISTAFLYLLAIGLAAIFLFPVLWSALTSISPGGQASSMPPPFWPTGFTFENYVKLNKYGAGIFQYIFNSGSVAILTVLGTILLSTLGGYGFSRFSFRGKNVLFLVILATLMIPFQSILTPLFLMLGLLGMQNTLVGLALVYITFQLPFGVFIMRNTFDAVPLEIEEAALLDGCNSFTLLYRVMLAPVLPGVGTVAIYAFINAWNEFLAALIIMSQEKKFTLPILLTSVRSGLYGSVDWGALQAGITVAIVPCVVLFLLLQRYYIRGLMGGAVKG